MQLFLCLKRNTTRWSHHGQHYWKLRWKEEKERNKAIPLIRNSSDMEIHGFWWRPEAWVSPADLEAYFFLDKKGLGLGKLGTIMPPISWDGRAWGTTSPGSVQVETCNQVETCKSKQNPGINCHRSEKPQEICLWWRIPRVSGKMWILTLCSRHWGWSQCIWRPPRVSHRTPKWQVHTGCASQVSSEDIFREKLLLEKARTPTLLQP